MKDRYAVVFQTSGREPAAGRLEIEQDRLLLQGRAQEGSLELDIPFADLVEVRVGRDPGERLNGHRALVLERRTMPTVRVAPFGVALLPEIAELLISLSHGVGGNVLVVLVPLRPGCLDRARKLLDKGPPLDPALLGLSGHEVYLREGEAVFVFRGSDVRGRVEQAIRHPAVWRAGLAWQRCFAGPPREIDAADLSGDADLAYRWPQLAEVPA